MATATIANIIAVKAPQFASDTRLNDLIDLAKLQTSLTAFGDAYNLAVALRVCHGLAVEANNGGDGGASTSGSGQGGAIERETEGDLSRTRKVGKQLDAGNLANSAYGLELLELIDGCVILPRTSYVDY